MVSRVMPEYGIPREAPFSWYQSITAKLHSCWHKAFNNQVHVGDTDLDSSVSNFPTELEILYAQYSLREPERIDAHLENNVPGIHIPDSSEEEERLYAHLENNVLGFQIPDQSTVQHVHFNIPSSVPTASIIEDEGL